MSFLAPLFLLGALGVALPILIHLIRRSSPRKIPFSALIFLQPTPPRITRKSRLENLFLLFLRCLVIGMLAFGFARPFLQRPMPSEPSAGVMRSVVLLVDASASLRREGMWEAALGRLEAQLRGLSPVDRVAVYRFDRAPRAVRSFEQWAAASPEGRVDEVIAELRATGPSWFSTQLGTALIGAADVLLADREEAAGRSKRIVVITDLQQGARLDGLQGHEWPRDMEVVVDVVKSTKPTNAGLVGVAEAGEFTAPAEGGTRRVRVVNAADSRRESFRVRWADGGTAEVEAYVPPGQSRVVQVPLLPQGKMASQLMVSGDDADFDNRHFLVEAATESVSVLYLGEDAGVDPAQPLFYLKRACQETRRRKVEIVTRGATAPPGAADLAAARLAFVGSALPAGSVEAMRGWISAGGTAVVVLRDAGMASTLAGLLELPALAAAESVGRQYALLEPVDLRHPLFAPFADARFSDFTKIHVWKHRRLAADSIPGARVLMRFDDGDPAMLEVGRGTGRLLVWTFGWQPVDSQFALSTKFVPLIYAIMEQAVGARDRSTQFIVGDGVPMPAGMTGATREVQKPSGAKVALAEGDRLFEGTDELGVYVVSGVEPPFRFAVNLDPAESRTAARPVEELERMRVPLRVNEVVAQVSPERKRQAHQAEIEARQKLWRWLIVAALVVLIVETWLSGRLSRGRPTAQEVLS